MFKCWLSLEAVNSVSQEKNALSLNRDKNVSKGFAMRQEKSDDSKRNAGNPNIFNMHNTGGSDYDKFGWSLSFSIK